VEAREIAIAISSKENLEWAWGKVKRYYNSETAWKDDVEIAKFSLNLQSELEKIAADYISGKYVLSKIRPIPQPKKRDADGNYRLRQLFWISVRDQVAWMAIVNIIGPLLDSQMPLWSFGNRLHRAVWFEKDIGDEKKLKIGPYRQSSGMTYRRFSQSWPLYRRYVYLTLRKLAKKEEDVLFDISDVERNIIYTESHAEETAKMPYLSDFYWNKGGSKVYWASIDFEKFYPLLDIQIVKRNILRYLNIENDIFLNNLFTSLTDFKVDYSDVSINFGDILLGGKPESFQGIPTGIMVGGFLANVGLLDVDNEFSKETKKFQVAHFRYVDDHIILAKSFDNLIAWIKKYKKHVEDFSIARINFDKTVPPSLQEYLKNPLSAQAKADAKHDTLIDPLYPKPLMTKTLTKVSQLAKFDFEFADESEQSSVMNDLELLMLADIGDSELPETTRISFAATLISRFSSIDTKPKANISDISNIKRKSFSLNQKLENIRSEWRKTKDESRKQLADEINSIKEKINEVENYSNDLENKFKSKHQAKMAKTYGLLLKAIHENPEKLRLWQRAIDYCFFTGYNGISKLQEELNRVRSNCEDSANYIESLLLSSLAETAIKSYCSLNFDNLSPALQNKKLNFLADTFSTSLNWSRHDNRPYYLKASVELFCITLVNLSKYIPKLSEIDQLKESKARLATFHKKSKKTLHLYNTYSINMENETERHGYWLWWVDTLSCSLHRYSPLPLLVDYMNKLSPSLSYSWTLWQKYPFHISDAGISEILESRRPFDKSQQGWIFDSFFQRVRPSKNNEEQIPRNVSPVLRALEKTNSLIYWNNSLLSTIDNQIDFDPRSSEWTALEIISQIIDLVEKSEITIHAANFLIPESWFNINGNNAVDGLEILTWESWRRVTNQNKIYISNSDSLISDDRIHPIGEKNWMGTWPQIRAVGLLLLNLLRRDFRFMTEWSPIRAGTMFDSSIRFIIGEVQCSSLTTGILEACLLPRARENVLIHNLQSEIKFDEDTYNDPPLIRDLLDLKKHILNAKKQLENYQFSMQAYKPKQLIPLKIEQLSKFGQDSVLNQEEDLGE